MLYKRDRNTASDMYHAQDTLLYFHPGPLTRRTACRKSPTLNSLLFLSVLLITSSCSEPDDGAADTGGTVTGLPGIAALPELEANPTGRVPLAAVIRFNAQPGISSRLTITEGDNTWSAHFDDAMAQDGSYRVPVAGMRPDREHDITLELTAPDGATETHRFTHRTPPLPANPLEIPPIDVKVSRPELMEPGVTFLSVRRRAPGRPHWLTPKQRRFSQDWGILTALDPRGEIIWYYNSEYRTAGIARLMNGNILMHRTDFSTIEIDLLGNTVRQFYAGDRPFPPPEDPDAIPIKGQQTLHHQPHQMPNGDFLAFSANGYLVENYYSSDTDPDAPRKDAMVMADTVVQITPGGEQVWSWNTFDYLDPFRLGYDTFWSYWWVRGFDQYMDWTHANGLSYDESDDSILVSLRNQSAILKIDRKTKNIKWILGRHDGWSEALQDKLLTPVGDLLWPGYQHNPRMTHAGTVILFDNRAHGGAMAFEERLPVHRNFSRGVEYEVDEETMTVRQVWTSGDSQGDEPCYTNAMSDAWRLPVTDNRLVIHAFCLPLLEGISEDDMDPTVRVTSDLPYGGRILEYAGDEIVFRADVVDPYELVQWEVYGGFRSPGIYHR